jgi:UDP-N-acetylmuramoylalanine--D-glutamate ligase
MARRAGRNVRVGGNLGTPVLELLRADDDAARSPDLYVLELSSFQLETTCSLNAVAAVVLNVAPDHMDRYISLEEYAAAKQKVYRGDGVMVINADDTLVRNMILPGRSVVRFTTGEPDEGEFGLRSKQDYTWLSRGNELLVREDELRIHGRHNMANALAALALGDVIGLQRQARLKALRVFPGLPHRCQWIREVVGVNWYNDSKATNVGATIATVQGLRGPLIVIAGGDGKGADFSPLREAFSGKVKALVLIGRDGSQIGAAVGSAVASHAAPSMGEAVALASELASPGDSVVLSPACASFDMYANFEARGDDYMREVYEVAA